MNSITARAEFLLQCSQAALSQGMEQLVFVQYIARAAALGCWWTKWKCLTGNAGVKGYEAAPSSAKRKLRNWFSVVLRKQRDSWWRHTSKHQQRKSSNRAGGDAGHHHRFRLWRSRRQSLTAITRVSVVKFWVVPITRSRAITRSSDLQRSSLNWRRVQ